ncbi:DUF4347 domain-containing protein [Marinomonas sp. A79]|uniref:DUF4347 domain-containing protein n=1 Tax=Marinomonas vulgaris TaxID=2823372 RepID=A0ABS5HDH8_9GAMM|nr:DUF4347 domain-containing protein [Marinomonas vulgaris]MBR7889685.1 DUF4347 domain-containing protein [Marinomonas vulgaris]
MKKHTTNNKMKKSARKPLITALEPRLLLDGAAVATAMDVLTDSQLYDVTQGEVNQQDSDATIVIAPTEVRGVDSAQNNGKKEVVFIEDNVDDYQTLIDGIGAGVEIVLLDSSQDGLAQMALWAESNSDYDAIHILSHGSEGAVDLGAFNLDSTSVTTRTDDLTTLGAALNQEGDLLLYGCEVASGKGQDFITALAQVTQADVAASDDLTGSAELGGDWELENTSGSIETVLSLSENVLNQYRFTFADETFDFESGVTGLNTQTVTAVGMNATFTIVGERDTIIDDDHLDSQGLDPINGSTSLVTGGPNYAETKYTFTIDSGKTFDLSSISLHNWDNTETFIFESSKGSASFEVEYNNSNKVIDVASHANAANFQGISSFTITDVDNGYRMYLLMDDLVVTNITSVSANNAPTISGTPTDITVTEDATSNIDLSVVTVADTDGDDLTVTLTASSGTLAAAAGSGSVTVVDVGSGVLTLSGSASAINTYLDTTTNIQYTGDTNVSGENAATLTIKANDGTADSATTLVNIDITAVNDIPVINNLSDGAPSTAVNVSEYIDVQGAIAGVVDVDGGDFNGGFLLIEQTSGTTNGSFLSDLDDITFKFGTTESSADGTPSEGDTVWYSDGSAFVAIGAVDNSLTGQDGADLRIDFNTNDAKPNSVGDFLAYIKYSASTEGDRSFSVTVNDGDGGTSAAATFTMQIVDNIAPTVVSIDRQTPSNEITNADSLVWRVTFSEAVTNIDSADFAVSGTTGTVTNVTSAGGNAYDVTVSGGDLVSYNGNVTLSFAGGQDITDSANTPNALTATTPTSTNNTDYTLDNTVSVPTMDLSNGSDTGSSNTDNITQDTTPTVTGTAEVGATVALYDTDETTSLGSATADGSGNWSITISALSAGSHTLTTKATDAAGNVSVASSGLTITVDDTAPTLSSSNPADGAVSVAPSGDITLTFSEDVNGRYDDITLVNVSSGAIVETYDAYNSGQLTFSGNTLTINPTSDLLEATAYAIQINSGAIQDTAGNSFEGISDNTTLNFTTGVTDTAAPTFLAIQRTSDDVITGDTTSFTLTFNEAVNVTAADFALATTGSVASTIGSITGSGTNTITVNVTGISGIGTLGLNLESGHAVTDLAGNALATAEPADDEVYTVDTVAPTLISINRLTDASTNADSVQFVAVFSENVTGLSADDFELTGTAKSGASISSVFGTANGYIITVNNISGDGSLGVQLKSAATLTDTASNALTTTTASAVTEQYTIDNTAPTATAIITTNTALSTADTVTFDVTFNEAVTNVTADDFEITGDVSGTITGITGSGSSYTVTVASITGDGALGLNFKSGQNITDTASNSFSGSEPSTDESYTIDNTLPTVASISRGMVNQVKAGTATDVVFTVVFNETVSGVASSDFAVTGNATNTGVSSVSSSDGKVFKVTVADVNGTIGQTLGLSFTGSADDAVSQASTATFTAGDTYTIAGTLLNEGALTQTQLDAIEDLNRAGTLLEQSVADATQVVIVDSRVPGLVELTKESNPNADIWLLDGSRSAVEQITEILANYSDLEALHILSHGGVGEVYLGAETLSESSITQNSGIYAAWGNALSDNGDILLYGCNVAQGDIGLDFINQLAQVTGADIAASDDLTGSAVLGGDWELEVKTDVIESSALSGGNYSGVLGNQFTLTQEPLALAGAVTGDSSWLYTVAIDYDSDGDQDFLAYDGSAYSFFDNDGSGSFTKVTPNTSFPLQNSEAFLVADFDNDGDEDVIVADGTGVPSYYQNNGDATFTLSQDPLASAGAVTGDSSWLYTVAIDYDSDGDQDFLAYDGSAYSFFDNDGSGSFTKVTPNTSFPLQNSEAFLVADFDNDGDEDVIVADGTGIPSYYRQDGTVAGTNNKPPVISATTPLDNGTGVETTANLVLTFDETIASSGTGTVNIYKSSDDSLVESIVGNDGRVTGYGTSTITINPTAELDPSTSYYIQIEKGALFDLDGMTFMGITDKTTLGFTTGAGVDSTAPTFDTTPATSNISTTTFDLTTDINEAGNLYYVVVADGAQAPTAAQVKAGVSYGDNNGRGAAVITSGSATVSSGAFSNTFNVTGLTASTSYDIYVVAEDDEGNPNLQSAVTKVDATTIAPANQAPTISGAAASQAVNDAATMSPFGAITLADADNDNVSVTVALDTAAKGAFTSASLTDSGFTDAGNGSYTLSSTTLASAQAALRALVFDPADNRVAVGSTETTTFTITVNDGTVNGTNNTTTVISTSINDTPTDMALSDASYKHSEGASNVVVGSFSATDADTGESLTYSLVAGTDDTNNGLFNINGADLRITDRADVSAGTYSVRVQVSDGDATYEEVFSITVTDDQAPSISTIAPIDNATGVSVADSIKVTLDEDLQLGDSGTITLYDITGNGANSVSIDVTSHASQLSIADNVLTINPTSNLIATNQYAVQFTAGVLKDDTGNAITAVTDITSYNFTTGTVDTTKPTVAIVDVADPTQPNAGTITINFSEQVANVDISDFTLTKDGTSVDISGLSVTGTGSTYTIDLSSVTAAGGTYMLTLATSNITDTSGNALSAGDSESFVIDTTASTGVAIVRAGAQTINGSAATFTAVFSDSVSGVDASDFTLTGTATGGTISNVTQVSDSVYTVSVTGLTSDGTLGVDLNSTGTGITDTAGNPISGGKIGQQIIRDTTGPSVNAINRDGAALTTADTATFTVSFNEAVTGVDASDFSLTAGATGNISSVIGSGSTYQVTVNSITGDGDLRLDLSTSDTGITDTAGNAISAGFTPGDTLTIDNTAAVVTGSQSVNLDEGMASGTIIGQVKATDSNGISEFSIQSGNDAGYFAIDNDGVLTLTSAGAAAIDYETITSYTLNIVATDIIGQASSAVGVTIAVQDINDNAPTIGSSSTASVAENTASTAVVYDANATDADSTSAHNTLTYSLKAIGDHSAFTIDPSTGEVKLNAVADYETKASYGFTVIATDGMRSTEKAVTLSINDVNDNTPVITSGTTGSVNENAATSTVIYTASATDADGTATNNTLRYSLTGDDAALLDIDDTTGVVTLKASADYETKDSYSFNVVATDNGAGNYNSGSLSSSEAVTISVNDLNDNTPMITSGATGSVNENVATSTVIYTASATDADGTATNNTLRYSLTGTDAGLLNINATTGEVTLKASADYETQSSYSFNVVATDNGAGNYNSGSLSSSQATTVSVIDINEAPVANSDSSSALEAGGVGNNIAGSNATGNVLTNDTDIDASDSKTVTAVSVSGSNGTVGQALTGDYGSLTLKADGSYTYIVDNSNTTVQSLQAGSNITDSFTYTLSDNGSLVDTATLVITINGANDNPTQTVDDASDISESVDAIAQDLNSSGSVSFADVDASDLIDVGFVSDSNIEWSAGTLDSALASKLVAGFSVTGTDESAPGTVDWFYSVDDVALDFLAVDETITFSYVVTVTDSQNATATDTVKFTIIGSNDAPTVSATLAAGITESEDASEQVLKDSGTVSFTDIDDTDLIDVTFDSDNNIVWSGGAIDSDLATQLLEGFAVSGTSQSAPGSVDWLYDVSGVDLDFLAEGESITFSYTVYADDNSGDFALESSDASNTDSATVGTGFESGLDGWSVNNDTNTVVVSGEQTVGQWGITPNVGSMLSINSAGGSSWDISATALSLSDESKTYISNTYNNGITQANYAYKDVELGAGETLSMAWNYVATDYAPYNDSSIATFVNLDNSDSVGKIDGLTGEVSLLGATVEGTANYTTGNYGGTGWQQVSFTATDAGTYRVGYLVFDLQDTANSPYLFIDDLAGETTKNGEPYDAIDRDENAPTPISGDGSTDSGSNLPLPPSTVVSFTITGSNDAPTVSATAAAGIAESSDASEQVLQDSGTVSFTDLDDTDVVDVSFGSDNNITWSAGTLDSALASQLVTGFSVTGTGVSAPGSVDWSYSVDDADLDFLAVDETITFSYAVTVTDSQNETATDTVSFTITGTNDAPVIQVVDVTTAINEGVTLTDNGSVTFTDLDRTDRPVATQATKSVTAKAQDGTIALTLTTAQQTAIENAFSIENVSGNTNNGTVNWTYNITEANLDFLGEGEVVTAVFTITVTDDEGATDTQDVTVTITGSNDTPDIQVVDVTGEITEGNTLTDTGSVTFTDVDLTDRPTATEATQSVTAKAQDGTTALTLTTAQQTAIENAFSIENVSGNTNNGTVNWTYDITEADLDFLGEGEVVTAVFTITVIDDQNATATQDVTVTITGSNDTPDIQVVDVAASITEGSTLTDTGSVTFTDVDLTDLPTATEATKSVTAKAQDGTTGLTLTSTQQAAIEAAFSIENVSGNTNNGTVNWTYDITEADLDFLGEGEVVTAVFTITVTDDEGAKANQDVTVTITGANDAPTIKAGDVVGEIIEGATETLTDTGSVTFTDVDLTDRPTATEATKSVTAKAQDGTTALTLTSTQQAAIEAAFSIENVSGNTNNGTVNWTYNITEADLDFLGEGEVVTAVFTITVTDDEGAKANQDVTVTITGVNDTPTITVVDVVASITEGTNLTDTGSVTFADVDLTDRPTATEATQSVTAKAQDGTIALTLTTAQQTAIENAFSIENVSDNTNNGTVNWAYNITEADLDFLGEDEVVTAVFTITVTDDEGATDTQDVTVTITGSNDTPDIQVVDVTGEITEGTILKDTGSVTFTDVDLTDRPTATEATQSVTAKAQDGTTALTLTSTQQAAIEAAFSIENVSGNTNNGTVNWTYDIAETDLDFLAKGEVVTAVFTITVTDDQNTTATQDVTVTITGANDAPTVTKELAAMAGTSGQIFTPVTLPADLFADVDANEVNTLVWSIENLPTGLVFNPANRTLSGTPQGGFEGENILVVVATDAQGAQVRALVSLTLDPAPVVDSGNVSLPPTETLPPANNQEASVTEFADNTGTLPQGTLDTSAGTSGFADNTGLEASAVVPTVPVNGVVIAESRVAVNVGTDGQVQVSDQETAVNTTDLTVASFTYEAQTVQITIADARPGGSYSATLADGTALPSWVEVNATTGEITMTPPEGQGALSLKINAVDADGNIRVLELDVDLEDTVESSDEIEDPLAMLAPQGDGYMPLDQQLSLASEQFDDYGSDLMKLLVS